MSVEKQRLRLMSVELQRLKLIETIIRYHFDLPDFSPMMLDVLLSQVGPNKKPAMTLPQTGKVQ